MNNLMKICVITFPLPSKSIYTVLFDLLKILDPLSDSLYVVTGGIPKTNSFSEKLQFIDIGSYMPHKQSIRPSSISSLIWILKCLVIQVKLSIAMLKVSKNVDIVIFFIGIPYLLMPMLVAKICKKKIVWY